MSHIAVERKRRRQMNDHLKVLRSLTPNFYIKRGDQASIIGGAIDYIKELHLVLHSLEIQQQEQIRTSAALSCKHTTTTTHSTTRWINPRSGPTSAAAAASAASTKRSRRQPLPSTSSLFTPPALDIISTPSVVPPSSVHNNYSKLLVSDDEDRDFPMYCCNSSCSNMISASSSSSSNVVSKEVVACSCISPVADVEAKISGANILLTTLTKRKPLGQLINIITTLETLSLEVLHLNISTMDDTVLYSFIVKRKGMDLLCTSSVPSSSSSYISVSASSLLMGFPSTFDGRNPAFLKFPTNITTNSNNHHNLNTTTPTFPPFPNSISTAISTVNTFSSSAAATAAATASQRDYAFDNISGDDGAKRHLSSSAARIFMRGLSNSTSAGFLAKTFSQFGEVRYVKIIINQCTKQSLGLAYVWFTCKESANIAVKEMDGKFVDGRFVSVEYARPESYARKTRSNSFLFRPK